MEKSRSMGDLHHLRLTALLRETGRLEKARISGPASCVYDALGKLRQQSRTSGGPSVSIRPTEYRRSRALVYKSLGECDTAAEDYDTAISLQPDNAYLHHSRGLALLNDGEHRTAIAEFDRAIELDPDYDEPYNERGVARVELGEHRRAVEDFDQFMRLNPGDPFVGHDRQLAIEQAEANGQ